MPTRRRVGSIGLTSRNFAKPCLSLHQSSTCPPCCFARFQVRRASQSPWDSILAPAQLRVSRNRGQGTLRIQTCLRTVNSYTRPRPLSALSYCFRSPLSLTCFYHFAAERQHNHAL